MYLSLAIVFGSFSMFIFSKSGLITHSLEMIKVYRGNLGFSLKSLQDWFWDQRGFGLTALSDGNQPSTFKAVLIVACFASPFFQPLYDYSTVETEILLFVETLLALLELTIHNTLIAPHPSSSLVLKFYSFEFTCHNFTECLDNFIEMCIQLSESKIWSVAKRLLYTQDFHYDLAEEPTTD